MTIKELKAILETMDENKDVFVFNWETSSMDDISHASDNNGHLQLNVCYEEESDFIELTDYLVEILTLRLPENDVDYIKYISATTEEEKTDIAGELVFSNRRTEYTQPRDCFYSKEDAIDFANTIESHSGIVEENGKKYLDIKQVIVWEREYEDDELVEAYLI